MTPPPAPARSRSGILLLAAIAVVLIAIAIWARPPTYMRGSPADPMNPEPSGAMAVAEMLRSHGVDLQVVRSASSALAANTDLLVITRPLKLSNDQLDALAKKPVDVVLIGVRQDVPEFLTGVEVSSEPKPSSLEAGCHDERAAAGAIDSGGLMLSAPEAQACFPGPDAGVMLTWEHHSPSTSGLRGTLLPEEVLRNDTVVRAANAALAMRVLGEHTRVTWLVADRHDPYGVDQGEDFSLAWLGAVLVSVTGALIWWLGPRFGRLVAEPLPVTVKASETTLGRGHLYRSSQDLQHAAQSLRLGALRRIANRVGIPVTASQSEVIARVASAAKRDSRTVNYLLYGPPPTDSRSLHSLALSLDTLEDEVQQI